jgi:hypothetical protein
LVLSVWQMEIPDEFATEQTRERLKAGCETMKQLLTGLLDSKGKVAEEVHAIRKLGKSLRGGFSLFRLEKSSSLEIQAIGRTPQRAGRRPRRSTGAWHGWMRRWRNWKSCPKGISPRGWRRD